MDNNEDLNQVNEEETLYDEMNIPEEIPIENYNDDGAYQAKSNKEIQKEKNIETNKKVSRMATEAAANYFGGPAAGKVVNAINNTKTGDRLNEAIGRKMNDISKRSFAGRNIFARGFYQVFEDCQPEIENFRVFAGYALSDLFERRRRT